MLAFSEEAAAAQPGATSAAGAEIVGAAVAGDLWTQAVLVTVTADGMARWLHPQAHSAALQVCAHACWVTICQSVARLSVGAGTRLHSCSLN